MLPLLFSRKNRSKSAANRKATRDRRSRRLVLECLEDRRLLTIIDMAAISGTLFYELPGGVRQPVPDETVSLYEDDGDGVFNSVLDTLKATDTTDGGGNYRFDSLTAGTYFVVQPQEPSGNIHPAPAPVVVTVEVTPEDANGAEGVILDEFGTSQSLTAQQPPDGTTPVSGSVVAPDAIGGYRQLIVNAFTGSLPVEAKINENNNSLFSYAEGPNVRGSTTVFWDGTPGNHTTVNPTGLGGVDLTGDGVQDSLVVVIPVTDVPAELTIVVYSDAGRASETMIQVPFFSRDFSLVIPFAAFTPLPGFGAADFANVGAVTFEIKKDPDPYWTVFGLDIQLERIRTVGPAVRRADLPYNVVSEIQLVKLTNGTDNDTPTGPLVPVGSTGDLDLPSFESWATSRSRAWP
jgi:large repetitive protein